MKFNKRGNILDNVETIGIIFGIMLILFIMNFVLTGFGDGIKANPQTNITEIVDNFDAHQLKLSKGWDFGVLFIAIMFPLFSFIAAKKIPTDTTYMIITFFILGFILLFSIVFSNIFGRMMDNTIFSTYMDTLRYIPWLFKNLLYYSIAYIFLVIIALYTKVQDEGIL